MDWLPELYDTGVALPDVPCLNPRTGFDHGDFKTYPERQGFHDRSARQWINFL